MIPPDATALAVVLLAIVPGSVATMFWARAKTWKGRSTDLATVLQSIVVSAVIQILASPLTLAMIYPYRDRLDRHEPLVALWLALVALAIPFVLGTLAARVSDALYDPESTIGSIWGGWVGRIVPPATAPTVWDWLFTQDIAEAHFW